MSAVQNRPLALVFDLDGVLLDSAPSHNRAFEEVFRPFGIRDFHYGRYAGWKTANVIEDVLRRAGLEPVPQLISDLSGEKSRLAREELRAANPVAPECIPLLTQLSQDYALALASSGSRASIALFLTSNECAHLFQSVLCGDDVSCAKPHPEIYLRTFATLDVAPLSALVVEDAVAGICCQGRGRRCRGRCGRNLLGLSTLRGWGERGDLQCERSSTISLRRL